MSDNNPPMIATHPTRNWMLDLSSATVTMADIEALDWERVFTQMQAIESADTDGIGHYWLRSPETAPTLSLADEIGTTLLRVQSFADAVHQGKTVAEDGHRFTDVLHIGMGGSVLGPQLLCSAGLETHDGLRPHFIDNLDPYQIQQTLSTIGERLPHTLIVVASKSGTTLETLRATAWVTQTLHKQGLRAAAQMIAITQPDSQLHQRATKERWLQVFPIWSWVGGRVSISSPAGLLTAQLCGISAPAFLQGARIMDEWTRSTQLQNNPAALFAGALTLLRKRQGVDSLAILPYSERLALLSRYAQQLFMESLGKATTSSGKPSPHGLTVFGTKGASDQHSCLQQLLDGPHSACTLLIAAYDTQASLTQPRHTLSNDTGDAFFSLFLGTRRALIESDRSCLTLTVPSLSPQTLGGMIALLERAVGYYALLWDLNAYDQPGVERAKKHTRTFLPLARAAMKHLATPCRHHDLAERLQITPLEALYLLEHLVAVGRIERSDEPAEPTYRMISGT